MATIEVDQDVYDFLLHRAVRIGEDASSILRRELGLAQNGGQPAVSEDISPTPLQEFLTSAGLEYTAKERFLALLGFLAKENGKEFEKVLKLRGRSRLYFARSEKEIEDSGTNTWPARIPDSSFWAMTNASNQQKRDILGRVMRALGYEKTEIQQAQHLLR